MDRHPRTPRRLTGVAGFLRALRNLGLVGHAAADDRRMQRFTAADGQPIPVRVLGEGALAGPGEAIPAPGGVQQPRWRVAAPSAAPVVLVHGLGCSHRQWLPVANRLRRHHRVFAWDARAHGRCVLQPGAVVTLGHLAGDLRQLLDHFGLERAALVGHSMGALTVLQYLQDHGADRVAAVGLVDQSPRIVTDEAWRLGLFGGCSREMLLGLIAGARRDLAGTVAHEVEAATSGWLQRHLAADALLGRLLRRWLTQIDTSALLDLAESLALADFRALLPSLSVPVWVVLGGRSAHYGEVALARYYRHAVPHAAVSVYPHSGHSPHVADPGRFARELLGFLDDHA